MATLALQSYDNATERLVVAVFIAVLAHGLVIFGVGFDWQRAQPGINRMEIVLVQSANKTPVEKADFLSQSDNQGGGEALEKNRPATPEIAPFPDPLPKVITTAAPAQAASALQALQVHEMSVTKAEATHREKKSSEAKKSPTPKQDRLTQATEEIQQTQPLSAAALIMSARNSVASLQAEVDRKYDNWAKQPRHKHIGANTKEYHYANYMESWRNKVERIGNLNYPEEARRRGLSGELTLTVALNANGTIYEVKVNTPSPYPALDDAAIRIVRLASPFSPFPESIKKETDVLHIIRRWQFSSEGMISDL